MENKPIDINSIESKAWAASFQDGILEIGLGLVWLVGAMVTIFGDYSYQIMPAYILPPVIMIILKRYVTNPRLGLIKYEQKRTRKNSATIAAITVILLILVTSTFLGKFIASSYLVAGIILAITFSIAYFMQIKRMYIYGILITIAFKLHAGLRETIYTGYPYLVVSIILIITGIYCLVTFVRRYTNV